MPACDEVVARRAILCGAAQPSEHEGLSKPKRRASESQSNFSWDKCAHFRCENANLQRLIHAKRRESADLRTANH